MSEAGRVRESLLRFWSLGEPWDTLRQRIADDDSLMAVVVQTPEDTIRQDQTTRIVFAAMAYLARKYAFDLSADPGWGSFGRLRRFLLRHRAEWVDLLQRPVQVNDPLRSVGLYPGLLLAARRVSRPITLVEIGSSLGLNLTMDRYRYDFRGAGHAGQSHSPCQLECEVDDLAARGRRSPASTFPLMPRPLRVAGRIGLDRAPPPFDDDTLAWMRAFHFPHSEHRFDQALVVRRRARVRMVKGDAVETLGGELEGIPADRVPLVYQTGVAYQMEQSARERLAVALGEAALVRRFFYLTLAEEPARRGGLIQLTDFDLEHGRAQRDLLGFITRWEPLPLLEWVHSETEEVLPGPDGPQPAARPRRASARPESGNAS